jgi:hypothetical protein
MKWEDIKSGKTYEGISGKPRTVILIDNEHRGHYATVYYVRDIKDKYNFSWWKLQSL